MLARRGVRLERKIAEQWNSLHPPHSQVRAYLKSVLSLTISFVAVGNFSIPENISWSLEGTGNEMIPNSWLHGIGGAGERVTSRQLSNSNHISFGFVIQKVCIARLFSTLLFSFLQDFYILICIYFFKFKDRPSFRYVCFSECVSWMKKKMCHQIQQGI